MFAQLVSTYHLHPIVDHFTIALLAFGIAAEILAAAASLLVRDPTGVASVMSQKLHATSLMLMIGGAAANKGNAAAIGAKYGSDANAGVAIVREHVMAAA